MAGHNSGGLERNPEFLKLWAAQTTSQVGSQVTLLALPLTGVLLLQATPRQLGVLYAAETAPFLLAGLAAGVWVDRWPRRRILIAGDLARAILLGSVPVSALVGALRIEQLYVVALLVGTATLFFDVAYQSFLPVLVGRAHVLDGNSRLEASRATAQIVGPGVGGVLVQVMTAPLAMAVDAVSFLVSGVLLLRVRAVEPRPRGAHDGLRAEMRDGVRAVLGNPLLRSIAGCTATSNLFSSALQAIFVLFTTTELGLSPSVLGFVLGGGSVGALLGALVTRRLARRVGTGRAIVVGISLGGAASVLIALAGGPAVLAAGVLVIAQALLGFGSVVYNVNQVSLRQAITPDEVQGRMNATMRFLVWGTMPIGALLGGTLGETFGLRPTLIVVAAGAVIAPVWVVLSPVSRLGRPGVHGAADAAVSSAAPGAG